MQFKLHLVKVVWSYSVTTALHIQSRVVRDVDKAENGCEVGFIIVQSYAQELGVDIVERC